MAAVVIASAAEPSAAGRRAVPSRTQRVAANTEPVRSDNRLADMPMVPIACRGCGAQVLARKSSWNQTSVQWNAAASARCTERQDADRIAGHGALFLSCSTLRESIEAAAATGTLAILDA
jgi:hypothetical protein